MENITFIMNIIILSLTGLVLLGISITDMFTYTIPHELNAGLFVLSITYFITNFDKGDYWIILSLFGVVVLLSALFQYYMFKKKKNGFGMGDSLMLGASVLFLQSNTLLFFGMAFIICSCVGLVYLFITKKQESPAGQFIATAVLSTLIFTISGDFIAGIVSIPLIMGVGVLVFLSGKHTIKELKEQKQANNQKEIEEKVNDENVAGDNNETNEGGQ